jgi:sulfur carrier protein
MKLTVNGTETRIPDELTIGELLKRHDVPSPQMVSIELNERIIPRYEYDSIRLKDNDKVEFLYFMGGGNN